MWTDCIKVNKYSLLNFSQVLKLWKNFWNHMFFWLKNKIREIIWNVSKITWKMIFSCDSIRINYVKCPKLEEFHFRFNFYFTIDNVLIIQNAPKFSKYLKCPIFPIWFWKCYHMTFNVAYERTFKLIIYRGSHIRVIHVVTSWRTLDWNTWFQLCITLMCDHPI